MSMNVTNITAATLADGGYIAGFNQNSTTFGGTLWTKRITDTTYKLGIEVRTAPGTATTWTTADYNINQVYNIVVGYTFGAGAADDTASLWVNGALVATDTHTGVDLNPINGFFLRQDSVTETPFITVDNLKIALTPAEVLAVSDIISIKNGSFVQNTFVTDEIKFGAKSDVKIYNMNGQVVKAASVSEFRALDASDLQPGMYIVTGTVEGQPVSQKILKK
ncbi:MAG: T9SS type A sorting domain-containing protein [Weeksellaceae bacterium]|nr:T9SS type A sorting domain-containing protein [Weeksellaceae bacterium]